MANPITISSLTTHIVSLFERDDLLRDVWVTGEVSNWKRAASGHIYFALKDDGASINSVMWKRSAQSHSWLPHAGDQILAHGYIGVYPDRGAYQLYVNRVQPAGRGQLYAQFEALKRKLADEGLFASERKRPIPARPQRIGIVTSADAAALRDILRVLTARWPLVDVVVFHTLVQGNEAPAQIVSAIEAANRYTNEEPLDLLILARGGGSIEDLWSFNDERVAYAVVNSALPIVTGVGHETDTTIVDFVADLRAPTPSAAAADVVPDRNDVRDQLITIQQRLTLDALALVQQEQRHFQQVQMRLQRVHPKRQLDLRRQHVDDRAQRLHGVMTQQLARLVERNHAAQQRLAALSPLAVLKRGYSIVQKADGQVVTTPDAVTPNEALRVRAAGGAYTVNVSK